MQMLILFFSSIADIIIGNLYFHKFGIQRFSALKTAIFSFIIVILQTINSFYFNDSIKMFIFSFVVLFILSFIFKIKWELRLLYNTILCIILSLSEVCVAMIITLSTDSNISQTQNDSILLLICMILSKFISFSIIKLIKIDTSSFSSKFSILYIFSFIIFPLTTVFTISILYKCWSLIQINSFKISILIIAILLIISNIIVLYLIERQKNEIILKNEIQFLRTHLKDQITHYEELYKNQDELKKFRHDIKNIFITLETLLKEKKIKESLQYINSQFSFIEKKDIVNSGNPYIDSIITVKLSEAKEHNIKLNYSIKLCNEIKIDPIQIGVLLGNAIDNSIEAINKITDKSYDRTIYLKIINYDNVLLINIKNAFTHTIDQKKLLTSKTDKNNHGYGLKSISAIAEANNGYVDISAENNIFDLTIHMQNEDTINTFA